MTLLINTDKRTTMKTILSTDMLKDMADRSKSKPWTLTFSERRFIERANKTLTDGDKSGYWDLFGSTDWLVR